MRELTMNEQNHIAAGNILSDVQDTFNDGVDGGERTMAVVTGCGGLVIGGFIGTFGAAVLAGGILAGYLFLDWANG